jgi:hypothetical protein
MEILQLPSLRPPRIENNAGNSFCIVACVSIAADTCLACCYLAMVASRHSIIPALQLSYHNIYAWALNMVFSFRVFRLKILCISHYYHAWYMCHPSNQPWLSSSLCNCLKNCITSSRLGPNILLSTLFSTTFKLFFLLRWWSSYTL